MERYIFTEGKPETYEIPVDVATWSKRYFSGCMALSGAGKTLFLEGCFEGQRALLAAGGGSVSGDCGIRRAAGAAAFRSDPCIMERIVSLFRTLT